MRWDEGGSRSPDLNHYRQRKGSRTHHRCVPQPPRYTICPFSYPTFAGMHSSRRGAPKGVISRVDHTLLQGSPSDLTRWCHGSSAKSR